MIIRKGTAEIDRIAAAGAVVAETIAHVGERIEPGRTTLELDRIAEDFIRGKGGIPTSQGYRGYPRAICISVNEVVVHGIPDDRVVEDGDLVTIDVGVTLDGAIADSAYTFGVGQHRRRGAAAARRRAGRPRGRHRRGAPRQPDRRHLARRAGRRRGRRVRRRQEPRGPRRRPALPRGPARPELRRAGPRPASLGGDDDRDRADDHRRQPRRVARARTAGRSRRRTAPCPPISSTPWRSCPVGPGSSRPRVGLAAERGPTERRAAI